MAPFPSKCPGLESGLALPPDTFKTQFSTFQSLSELGENGSITFETSTGKALNLETFLPIKFFDFQAVPPLELGIEKMVSHGG